MRSLNEIRADRDEARKALDEADATFNKIVETRGQNAGEAAYIAYSDAKERFDRLSGELEAAVRDGLATGELHEEQSHGSGIDRTPRHKTGKRARRANPWVRGESRSLNNMDRDELAERGLGALDRAMVEATIDLGDTTTKQWRSEQLSEVIEKGDRETAEWALVAGDPAYGSAFEKQQRSREGYRYWTDEERDAARRANEWVERASLNDGTAAQGGALVPIVIDPDLQLTNTGAINPWDRLCKTVTTSTYQYRNVTTAGVLAEFDAEGGTATDLTPNDLAQNVITPHRGTALVYATWEYNQDVPDLASQIGKLLADGKARIEADQFVNGLGDASNAPNGWLLGTHGIAGVTASRVASNTNGAFDALLDPFTTANALPARYHANGPAWTAHYSVGFEIRRQAAKGNGQGTAYWQDISDGGVGDAKFLGYPYVPNSQTKSIPLSAATASSDYVLAIASWNDFYTIVRRAGVVVGNVFPTWDQATARPNFKHAFYMLWRAGGDVTNPDAARILVV